MSGPKIQPTPNHYWDTKSMSWKLPGELSELSHTLGSTYSPEMVVIRKDWIYAAQSAIESGIESALQELQTHDRDLGRTTPKNKRAAENMEREIQKMRTAKNRLNDFTFSHHLS